jgi:flagellar protein FlgJ
MNITPLLPHSDARLQAGPIEELAGNKSLSEADKIKEASRQFEALILRQILGQARKTVFRSSVNQDSMSSSIYQDMVTNQLADAISQSGSFGLASSLQLQLGPHRQAQGTPPQASKMSSTDPNRSSAAQP